MLTPLRHLRRLLTIACILAREDALFPFADLGFPLIATLAAPLAKRGPKKRPGLRLAAAFERLGPAFIKLGQTLSTRSDLIGEAMAEDLGSLRDRLPPFPTTIARAIIEEDFAQPVASLFSEFDDTPVAAASIAQVHCATTLDGRNVAVKILRPGIKDAFARDMELFAWLAGLIERRARRLKPLEVVATLRESVFFELDLRFEAAAASELAENIKHHEPGFRVPAVDWALTSKRVLATEWVDGIRLNDIPAIRASGLDPSLILAKAARSLFSQVFVDGFFHADLHPGNLFVDSNGDIVAVDFGIMGRLDWDSRLYIAEILRGFLEEDYRHVAEVHFTAGYVPAHKSIDAFTQACMAVGKPITNKKLNEISIARLLGQMFSIAGEFEMETQPQLLLLQKTMMVTEGVGHMLDPDINMWQLARPLIEEWAAAHFGPLGKLKAAAKQGKDGIERLPLLLRRAENALANLGDASGIRLHPQTIDLIADIHLERRRQWLLLGWSALAAATLFAALLLAR